MIKATVRRFHGVLGRGLDKTLWRQAWPELFHRVTAVSAGVTRGGGPWRALRWGQDARHSQRAVPIRGWRSVLFLFCSLVAGVVGARSEPTSGCGAVGPASGMAAGCEKRSAVHLQLGFADGNQDPDAHTVAPDGVHRLTVSRVTGKGRVLGARACDLVVEPAVAGEGKRATVEGVSGAGPGPGAWHCCGAGREVVPCNRHRYVWPLVSLPASGVQVRRPIRPRTK